MTRAIACDSKTDPVDSRPSAGNATAGTEDSAADGADGGDEGAETMGDFYGRMLDDAFEGQSSAWLLEYTWMPSKCDPCTGPGPLDGETVHAFGYMGYPEQTQYTRLRVRYTPEGAAQDLLIQPTYLQQSEQVRYIRYDRSLESDFPLCEEGWVTEDPGSCKEEARASRSRQPKQGSALPAAMGGILMLVAALRRRP